MNQKEKLIQAFIDDIDDHDFLSGSRFNLDDEQTLSVRVADEDDAPILEIDFENYNSIPVYYYYSKFGVNNPSKNKWLFKRIAALIDDLEKVR
ncbi:hypothetical protein [uncultured Lactobacillus sp.]|uniref:hypothetical protein n=1 Tax=uncultured Lactobacillus sp. TaxID=153152 RepID=UPI0025835F6D|nr:hypothetical protein [uncultured Lactobacillus sp.]